MQTLYRYKKPSTPLNSFLRQALLLAPSDEIRMALLKVVDWDAPDMARSEAFSMGGQMQSGIHRVHPLETIVHLGDEALFKAALLEADAKSQTPTVVSLNQMDMLMSDWERSGVVAIASAIGTRTMLNDLLSTLQSRTKLTSDMNLNLRSPQFSVDPWTSMARWGSHEVDSGHYKQKFKLLDRYYRGKARDGLFTKKAVKPMLDGSGPITAWEKRARGRLHTHALEKSAKHGNPSLLSAVLELGYADRSLSSVNMALVAKYPDLAWKILDHPGFMDHLMSKKTDASPSQSEKKNKQREIDLSSTSITHGLFHVGECVKFWSSPSLEPELDVYRGEQLACAQRVCVRLVELMTCFTRDDISRHFDASHAQPQSKHRFVQTQALLVLDETQAQYAYQVFEDRTPLGQEIPTLDDLKILWGNTDRPWAQQVFAGIRTIRPDRFKSYTDSLMDAVVAEFRANDNDTRISDTLKAIDTLWQARGHDAHITLGDWVSNTLLQAQLDPQKQARIEVELLGMRTEHAPLTRRAPRL